MRERIENAKRRAVDARMRALGSGDPKQKAEWLDVARVWDELANEYEVFERHRAHLQVVK